MYRLETAPAAERDLNGLQKRMHGQEWERLRAAIRGLAGEPRPHGVRKIRETDSVYRIRAGDHRVIYDISEDDRLVLILRVLRRSETTYRR